MNNLWKLRDAASACKVKDGAEASQWIYDWFGECVRTDLEYASFFVGLFSIAVWLCSQAPQIIKSCFMLDASALALGYLIEVLIGDLANFVGGLLTGALFTQLAQAAYFLIMDTILFIQYFTFNTLRWGWKKYLKTRKQKHAAKGVKKDKKNLKMLKNYGKNAENAENDQKNDETFFGENLDEDDEDKIETPKNLIATTEIEDEETKLIPRNAVFGLAFLGILVFVGINLYVGVTRSFSNSEDKPATDFGSFGRKLMSSQNLRDDSGEDYGFPPKGFLDWVGYVIGWFSGLMYLGSRIFQIYRNFRRLSTEGLSPIMFLSAVLGNLSYGVSIFLYSVHPLFILGKLPWLVGSLGVLALDFFILFQFVLFNKILKRKVVDGSKPKPKEKKQKKANKQKYVQIE